MRQRLLAAVLSGVMLAGCAGGAEKTTTPTSAGATTTAVPQDQELFEKIGLELVRPDGKVCQLCVKIANTPEKRALGLSGAGAFDGAHGMLFYSGETMTDSFWMKGVAGPLDIHFFSLKGAPLNSVTATPCAAGTPDDECPRYKAAAPYGYALEVSPETTKRLGITGASLGSIMESCPEKAQVVTQSPTTKPGSKETKPVAPSTTIVE